MAFYAGILCLVFAYTLADNCVGRPDGLIIGTVFTILLMLVSGLSRSIRSVELRIPIGYFADVESWRMGPQLRGKKVHLVPVKSTSPETLRKKRAELARHYSVRGPFFFLHVNLLDNRSEFQAPLEVTLRKEDDDYVGEVHGAIAIANTIAYISEAIDPISFSSASPAGPREQAVRHLFGEARRGSWYTILLRY
jgi:hypothetical protein